MLGRENPTPNPHEETDALPGAGIELPGRFQCPKTTPVTPEPEQLPSCNGLLPTPTVRSRLNNWIASSTLSRSISRPTSQPLRRHDSPRGLLRWPNRLTPSRQMSRSSRLETRARQTERAMIYDPKKPKEPPPPPHPSPRGSRSEGLAILSDRNGHCVQCGKAYGTAETIILRRTALAGSPLPIHGAESQPDGWHPSCWEETHAED